MMGDSESKGMGVVWTATSPDTGRFSPVYEASTMADLSERFNALRAVGRGYMEVRLPDGMYPRLTFGFRGDHAVIHLFESYEKLSLLVGYGTVPPSEVVDVQIMDDLAPFTGEFVLNVDDAWNVVREFVDAGAANDLGEWSEV